MAQALNPLVSNAGRLGATPSSRIANIVDGAQLGFGPHLPLLDAGAPLVLPMATPIVLNAPTMFQYVDGMEAVLKTLIERQVTNVDGIDFTRTTEVQGTPIGHDGQQQQIPTAGRRSQPSPSMTFRDVTGGLVYRFFELWANMTIDADTQASTLAGIIGDEVDLLPQLPSSYSMDMLVIQFDMTYRPKNIVDAAIYTAMFPTDIGGPGFRREAGNSTFVERNIQFAAVVQHNSNTRLIGQQVAEVLGMHRVNYDRAVPVAQAIHQRLADQGRRREVIESINTFTPSVAGA